MHEGSIARAILETVKQEASEAHIRKVKKIWVCIGEIHAVVEESLIFLFDMMKEDYGMKDAVLRIRKIPLKIRCKDCGHEFHPEDPIFLCPKCGSLNTEILQGEEMLIEKIVGEK